MEDKLTPREIKELIVQKLLEINSLITQARQQSIITEIEIELHRGLGDLYNQEYLYLKRFCKIENI